jgi:cysteinyl-tRNA synthetase
LSAGGASYRNLLKSFSALSGKGSVNSDYKNKFEEDVNDDLGISGGIAVLWQLLKDSTISASDKRATIHDFDRVLGLDIEAQSKKLGQNAAIPHEIYLLGEKREEARKAKNFSESDRIRKEIQDRGYDIQDTDAGQVISKISLR